MEVKFLKNLADFEKEIQTLEERREQRRKETPITSSEYLYRGQGDSNWNLETTLDRYIQRKVSLLEYYRYALISHLQVESFTSSKWPVPAFKEYSEWLQKPSVFNFSSIPAYEFLAYLRHHGFPSPLLDWTASPYIAAFFAYRTVNPGAEHVSIYVYQEYFGAGKSSSSNTATIHSQGPHIKTHKRHFMQKSEYTFCTEIGVGGELYYAKHEDIVARNYTGQDILWKYNLPMTERKNVLRALEKMNINAFTLFGTEDSLMEAIATKEMFINRDS